MIEGKLIPGCGDKSMVFEIRSIVFTDEQGFSAETDIDSLDDVALHLLVYDSGEPAATARLYQEKDGSWHIGRVAVLKEFRGRGIGAIAMRILMQKARSFGAEEVHVGAQRQAEGFYRILGFEPYGEEYMDEHVPHTMMKAELTAGCQCEI